MPPRDANPTPSFGGFGLKEERRRSEEALRDMTKAPNAGDWPLRPWLHQAVPELLAGGVEQFAELERGLVQRDGRSMRVLDRVAEETGVRVIVRRTGALTIQFKVPRQLVPPGDSDKVLIKEPEQAMLSQTSLHYGRNIPISRLRPRRSVPSPRSDADVCSVVSTNGGYPFRVPFEIPRVRGHDLVTAE